MVLVPVQDVFRAGPVQQVLLARLGSVAWHQVVLRVTDGNDPSEVWVRHFAEALLP